MRAGRLLNLLLLLHDGGRMTAGELARRLEVSPRTVLRDIEVLSSSGVPVYAVRGPQGGFELLDTFRREVPAVSPGLLPGGGGRLRRVRVRLSPSALQLALVLGRPEGWRPRPHPDVAPGRPDWIEGTFRFDSDEGAVRELLALGPEVEVVLPVAMREAMADVGRRIAALHQPLEPTTPPGRSSSSG